MSFEELIRRLSDPVKQAEDALAAEEHERTRTDPWKWYCRICGETGEADTEQEQIVNAHRHTCIANPAGVHTAGSGRLLHIWKTP